MLTIYTHIIFSFFFFNDTATTEIYTLSLHDALPICRAETQQGQHHVLPLPIPAGASSQFRFRSEEHTSELQSRGHLVCRLLLEKKKKKKKKINKSKTTNKDIQFNIHTHAETISTPM